MFLSVQPSNKKRLIRTSGLLPGESFPGFLEEGVGSVGGKTVAPLATNSRTQLPPVTGACPREAAALNPTPVLGTSSCGSAQKTPTQGQTRSQVAGTPADHPNPNLLREGPSPSLLPTPPGLPGHGLHPGYGVHLGPWAEGWGWGEGSQVARVRVGWGAGCVPCVSLPATPTMSQAPSASRAQGPRSQSIHRCKLVAPALHSETHWVMGAHGIGLARPRHCVQLPAGSPCPPPALPWARHSCASADLLLWWREGATRGTWPWRLQAISEAREAKLASERRSRVQGTARVTPPFCPAPSPHSCPRLHQALGDPAPTPGLDC